MYVLYTTIFIVKSRTAYLGRKKRGFSNEKSKKSSISKP